jgi:hypothetical protein
VFDRVADQKSPLTHYADRAIGNVQIRHVEPDKLGEAQP